MRAKPYLNSRIVAQRLYNKIRDDAGKGDANAIYEWGNVFYLGMYGIRPNKETAFSLYRLAAAKGHEYAKFMLASCYFDGIGHERDYAKAGKVFKWLVDHGWKDCWALLGKCYLQTGHSKKAKEAFLSAEQCGDNIAKRESVRLNDKKPRETSK